MCHGVCQVLVHLEDDRVVQVTGDPESPISRGYLCPKGKASPALLDHPDRLTHPLRRVGARGENRWQRVSWSEAIDEVVDRFDSIRKQSGSEYLAIVTGTGRPYIQMSLRFANALGTPNFVAPGQVCYLPRQIASRLTLGQLPVCDIYGHGGVMPACILVWGCDIVTNAASDGMCGGPFLQAVRQARKVIAVDPRRTSLAKRADHWLQLRPGTDGALALAMIHVIIARRPDGPRLRRSPHGGLRRAGPSRARVHAGVGRVHHAGPGRGDPRRGAHLRDDPARLHPVGSGRGCQRLQHPDRPLAPDPARAHGKPRRARRRRAMASAAKG